MAGCGSSCRFIAAAFIVYAHCATAGVELKLACTVYTQSAFHSGQSQSQSSYQRFYLSYGNAKLLSAEWSGSLQAQGVAGAVRITLHGQFIATTNRRKDGRGNERTLGGLLERLSQVF